MCDRYKYGFNLWNNAWRVDVPMELTDADKKDLAGVLSAFVERCRIRRGIVQPSNEQEIMEQWLAEHQERPEHLTVERVADIIYEKSKNIKMRVPAWVFKTTFKLLHNAYGYRFAEEDGVEIPKNKSV